MDVMTKQPTQQPTTTQILNLAQAKSVVDGMQPSETKNMLVRAIWHATKRITGESHKDPTS